LYDLRSQYDKSNPLNFIAKILLNSLYGRFGMDDNFANINIIHKDYYPDFENKFFSEIIKTTEMDEYILIEFENVEEDDANKSHDVSISVAAAITAYARVHQQLFKSLLMKD
jgi:hypothetical protein